MTTWTPATPRSFWEMFRRTRKEGHLKLSSILEDHTARMGPQTFILGLLVWTLMRAKSSRTAGEQDFSRQMILRMHTSWPGGSSNGPQTPTKAIEFLLASLSFAFARPDRTREPQSSVYTRRICVTPMLFNNIPSKASWPTRDYYLPRPIRERPALPWHPPVCCRGLAWLRFATPPG